MFKFNLTSALAVSIMWFWIGLGVGGVFWDAWGAFIKAEWKKFKSIPKNNDADAAKEIPKITVA